MRRPNIIYLHCHDAGRAATVAGGAIECPNLTRFARGAVNFRQAFAAAPTCSPSRAALLTGRHPSENGMQGLAHLGFRLNDYRMHLANALRPAGYGSYLCGFQHVCNPPLGRVEEIGYDEILSESGEFEAVTGNYVKFLGGARQSGTPFFLDVGFFAPHRPFPALEVDVPGAALGAFPQLVDTPQHQRDVADFARSLLSFDVCCGRILDALAAAGLDQQTLVIITTDHGPPFPGMKGTLYDAGLGVMLLMRLPGVFEGGLDVRTPVSQLDIYPTLLALAGLSIPDGLPGQSLLQPPRLRDFFFETNWHAAWEPARAVRTNRWKYIRNYALPRGRILPNIDDSPSKALLFRTGALARPLPAEELYDLLADPLEQCNLAGSPEHEPQRMRCSAKLDAWMQARGDLMLIPEPPKPAGIIETPWEAYTPCGRPGELPADAALLEIPE